MDLFVAFVLSFLTRAVCLGIVVAGVVTVYHYPWILVIAFVITLFKLLCEYSG